MFDYYDYFYYFFKSKKSRSLSQRAANVGMETMGSGSNAAGRAILPIWIFQPGGFYRTQKPIFMHLCRQSVGIRAAVDDIEIAVVFV